MKTEKTFFVDAPVDRVMGVCHALVRNYLSKTERNISSRG